MIGKFTWSELGENTSGCDLDTAMILWYWIDKLNHIGNVISLLSLLEKFTVLFNLNRFSIFMDTQKHTRDPKIRRSHSISWKIGLNSIQAWQLNVLVLCTVCRIMKKYRINQNNFAGLPLYCQYPRLTTFPVVHSSCSLNWMAGRSPSVPSFICLPVQGQAHFISMLNSRPDPPP